MRKIPMKNYIILSIITVATLLATSYFANVYSLRKEYENSTNVRMNFLKEIRSDEFASFITENPDFLLYISNSDDKKLIDIEKDLKKQIINRDYTKDIIYLNSKNVSSEFKKELENYFVGNISNIRITTLPNFIIVKSGSIEKVLYFGATTDIYDIIDFVDEFYGRE